MLKRKKETILNVKTENINSRWLLFDLSQNSILKSINKLSCKRYPSSGKCEFLKGFSEKLCKRPQKNWFAWTSSEIKSQKPAAGKKHSYELLFDQTNRAPWQKPSQFLAKNPIYVVLGFNSVSKKCCSDFFTKQKFKNKAKTVLKYCQMDSPNYQLLLYSQYRFFLHFKLTFLNCFKCI